MKVLLIYETVPEGCDVYQLRPTEEELAKLVLCHAKYGNSVALAREPQEVQDAVDWLADQILNHQTWTKQLPEEPFTIQGDWCVIRTGFML